MKNCDEELEELSGASAGTHDEIENEIGDLLFVIVNLARFMKVDPEQALRKTNAKFRRRFAHVEAGWLPTANRRARRPSRKWKRSGRTPNVDD